MGNEESDRLSNNVESVLQYTGCYQMYAQMYSFTPSIQNMQARFRDYRICSNFIIFFCLPELPTIVYNPNPLVSQNLNNQLINLSIKQSIYQSINLSINQSINQLIYQSINLSINHSINQSIYQSINISINQSINQSICLSINQLVCQSIEQSMKNVCAHYQVKFAHSYQRYIILWLNQCKKIKSVTILPPFRQ